MAISGRSPRPALAVGVLLTALGTVGCGSGSGGTAPPAGTATPQPASVSATTLPPRPSPSAPPPATAADGTDYAACGDGACEISVSAPVDLHLGGSAGPGTFAVRKVDPDGIDFMLTWADGSAGTSYGSIGGNCTATFHRGGGGVSCSAAPSGAPAAPSAAAPRPRAGELAVQVVDIAAGTAILRLVSG